LRKIIQKKVKKNFKKDHLEPRAGLELEVEKHLFTQLHVIIIRIQLVLSIHESSSRVLQRDFTYRKSR